MNEIVKALEQMESRIIGHVDQRVNDLRTEMNELRTEMNQRFDEVHKRIHDLDNNQIELLAQHAEKQNMRMNIMQLEFESLTKRVERQELITKHLL